MRSATASAWTGAVLTASVLCVGARPASAQTLTTEPVTSVSIELDMTLPGSPEEVYVAITGDVSEWRDHRFSEDPRAFVLEPEVEGRFIESEALRRVWRHFIMDRFKPYVEERQGGGSP